MSEQLPPGWSAVTFGEIVTDAQNGCSARTGTGTPTIVLRLADVSTDGSVATEGLRRISLAESEATKYRLEPGDLLAFRVNGSRDIAGRVINYKGESGHAYCDHFIRFRVDATRADPDFVAAAFKAPAPRGAVEAAMVSSAGQNTVSQGTLRAVPLPLPPLDEQRRIVRKLGTLNERSRRAREALDSIPPLLEKLRQSILAAAFRGDLTKDWRAKHPDVEPASELLERIRVERRKKWEEAELAKMVGKGKPPKDDRWKAKYEEPKPVDPTGLPELPEGWCWASMAELSSAVRTPCYGVVQPGDEHAGAGVRLVRVCDLVGDGRTIDTSALRTIEAAVDDEYARSRLVGDELLVSVVGTVGRTALASTELAGANIARAIARVAFTVPAHAEWTMYWLNTAFMWAKLNRDSREVARKTLNVGQLVEMPVPLAPNSEAASLVERLRSADTRRRALGTSAEAALQRMPSIDAAILARAFRGGLFPDDAVDERSAEQDVGANRGAPPPPSPRREVEVGTPTSSARPKRTRRKAS